jgi:UDP-glucose 4-epimerase
MIIHLAAHARVHDLVVRPDMALENYVMTYNVLEYARQKGIKRIIYASSREIYGESKPNQTRKESDSSVVTIKSPYTASKYGSEALVHAYHECYGIKPVIVRFSNVYGRFDVSERVVPLFIYYALRNRDITIFGKEKKLDFTYTDDAIGGLMAIIRRFDRVSGMTFNLSRGRGERLVNLAQIVVEQLKSESKIKLSTKRIGEISSYVGDISLAKKHLGFKPKVLLKDGLARNIEWYLSVIKNRRIYDYQRRNLLKRGWA